MTWQSGALVQFDEKFRTEELLIAEFRTWRLSLRPGQLTLGAMVLSLRSGGTNLADLSSDEGRDMAAAFGWAEAAAREHLRAVRLNLLCLMMQDPIVHFHILPRYDRPVDHAGQRWTDVDWPGPPTIRLIDTDDGVLHAIRRTLR